MALRSISPTLAPAMPEFNWVQQLSCRGMRPS